MKTLQSTTSQPKNDASSRDQKVQEMDKRLEAIKEILVGNQFERMDSKFKHLNQRMESTSTHLINLVEDLSKQLVHLKKEQHKELQEERKQRRRESETLEDKVQSFKNRAMQENTSPSPTEGQVAKMERRVKELENLAHRFSQKQNEALEKQKVQLQSEFKDGLAQQEKKQDSAREKVRSTLQERLDSLEKELEDRLNQSEDRNEEKLSQQESNLRDLQEEVREHKDDAQASLETYREELMKRIQEAKMESPEMKGELEELNQRLEQYKSTVQQKVDDLKSQQAKQQQRQDQRLDTFAQNLDQQEENQDTIQQEFTDLVQRLGDKVSTRLNKGDEERSKLRQVVNESNQSMAKLYRDQENKIQENTQNQQSIQEFLEKELVPFLQQSKSERGKLEKRLEELEKQFSQDLHDATVRMEGRLEGILQARDQDRKAQENEQKEKQEARKKDLKETLEKLSNLLDE